jgi:prolyl-tRNA synthetase
MHQAYNRIFMRLGLKTLTTEADSGIMGGKVSHEFMVPARDGEDVVATCVKCKAPKVYKEGDAEDCPKCKTKFEKVNCIEVGHIFKLGTKYSAALGANFLDAKGKLSPVIMGCYGIGVSRLISAVIEQNNDAQGIIWPEEAAPYQAIILPLDATDEKTFGLAVSLYNELKEAGIEPLLDDRDERAGVKFKDADLLGIPLQVIIGKEALKADNLELKLRRSQEKIIKPKAQIIAEIKHRLARG